MDTFTSPLVFKCKREWRPLDRGYKRGCWDRKNEVSRQSGAWSQNVAGDRIGSDRIRALAALEEVWDEGRGAQSVA